MANPADAKAHLVRFGPFELDVRAGELRKHGIKIKLREQPVRILVMLLDHPGEVVLRDEIQARLWPNNTIVEFDHGINAAIQKLRDALGDSAAEPRYIETVARRGYRFLGEVEKPAGPPFEIAQSQLEGKTLSHYRILEKLGEGGMGVVWRAHDSRLKRDVAIKISQEAFSGRFEREARAIAALNHPNICTVYDVGPDYLVMELIEGESPKGPLALDQALRIARQIADALDAAHEKGIVHRDLKPGNIKIKPDGTVKVLDFGLAKTVAAPSGVPPDSPTMTISPTRAGVILGTAAYMSPEQAGGKPVDKRADIWAFGVVLYELLTGRPPFHGSGLPEILASVVKDKPDLSSVPVQVRPLLARCLDKDPKTRLRDIGDVWDLLEDTTAATGGSVWARQSSAAWTAAAVLAIVAVAACWIAWRATRPVDHLQTRFSIDLGPEAMTGANATAVISPDGRRLVFPARGSDGKQQLATRLLDQAKPTLLPGAEGGVDPFFSPDGQWIGFFADGHLKKISVQGGAPVPLTSILFTRAEGASWGDDGNIVTATGLFAPLVRIPAGGGPTQLLNKLGPDEVANRWPQVLPGARAVLFTAPTTISGVDTASIEALSLKTGQVKIIERGGYFGRYLPSGHLLYMHQGILFGVRFDPERLEARGTPTPLLYDVAANVATGSGQFDFSTTGTFVYTAGQTPAQAWRVGWLDGSGRIQPLLATPGTYTLPRLSPDGRKLAFIGGGQDVYIYDLDRDTVSRLTSTGHANSAVWAPDGKHIVFESLAPKFNLYWVRSDGAGEPQPLLESPNNPVPWSFSPDGRRLAYFERIPRNGHILTLPLDLTDPDHPKAGKPEPFLDTQADELLPSFSPDGHWIAYRSNESGSNEIYVRPFPARSGGKWQISSEGGQFAFWSKNGRELFYESADSRIMVVDYAANGDSFAPAKPRVWSETQIFNPGLLNLDLAADGKRFAVLYVPELAGDEKASVHVTVLLNFFDEVKRRIPAVGQ